MITPTFDPATVLGCSEEEAAELLAGKRVTPGEVESVAASSYDWRRHVRDPRSYWVTAAQAARILRRSPGEVRRLLDNGRLPYIVHVSGVRLMRRHQLEELAAGLG